LGTGITHFVVGRNACLRGAAGRSDAAKTGEDPIRGASGKKEEVVPVVINMFLSPLAFGVACIPLIAATSAAYAVTGTVSLYRLVVLAASAIFIILWLNLSNDAFDAVTGVDVQKVESVVNRTGKRKAILWAANICLAIGILLMVAVVVTSKQYTSGLMLLAAVSMGYIYQGPPFRLSYKGLGEFLCFIAFGPLATNAFFLMQTGLQPSDLMRYPLAIVTSTLLGLTTSTILLNSHYHQIESDARSGKLSPAVRLGTKKVTSIVFALVSLVYVIYLLALAWGIMPLCTLPPVMLSTKDALHLCRFIRSNHEQKQVIKPAKFLAVKWHRNFAILLSFGLLCTGR